MQRHLLLVDDESNILSSLSRLFRRENYIVHTASSGKEALDILNSQTIGVIISDQMMPVMTGVEFLYEAQKIQPDSIRMVLSGYTELKTILESINRGSIWRFLTKPWEDGLLKDNVQEAFKQFELKSENTRLTIDLKKANAELQINNRNLELIIKEKTRSLQINFRMLQVSQEVLEQLPIGVIGVDENGCIVLSNQKANSYFFSIEKLIIGKQVKTIFPEEIMKYFLNCDISSQTIKSVELANKHVQVHIRRLRPPGKAKGTIFIFSQSREVFE